MTIVEIERVSAPPKEREDAREERERRAGVLEAAALEIGVRGWCRVDLENADGNVCLVGGVCRALGYEGHLLEGAFNPFRAANEAFGGDDERSLYRFNDERGRTADEVTFLLRWRAEEIRDGR